jgi:hypothetical protein
MPSAFSSKVTLCEAAQVLIDHGEQVIERVGISRIGGHQQLRDQSPLVLGRRELGRRVLSAHLCENSDAQIF